MTPDARTMDLLYRWESVKYRTEEEKTAALHSMLVKAFEKQESEILVACAKAVMDTKEHTAAWYERQARNARIKEGEGKSDGRIIY